MEAFLISEFWESLETHVTMAPGQSAEGLELFLEHELGEQGWCLFQTSGSEGERKWVMLTKEKLQISACAVNAHYGATAHDHWLLALPTHHVGGFGVLARAFQSGSPVTRLEGKWDTAVFVRRCEDVGATLTSLVPTQIFDLVAERRRAPLSLRVVLVGGGALSPEIEASALSLGWPVRRTYGMTETASQVASQREVGGEMEVLPVWSLDTDRDGVLRVRGAALAEGYAVREGKKWRREPILADAGLRTRDRVSLHAEGGRSFLRFIGREVGIVKILGELVALGPVQQRIDDLRLRLGLMHGDAVVCDTPDPRRESKLVLVVSGLTQEQAACLQSSLNETSPPMEQIEEIRLLASLPRGELGKILLPELRAQL